MSDTPTTSNITRIEHTWHTEFVYRGMAGMVNIEVPIGEFDHIDGEVTDERLQKIEKLLTDTYGRLKEIVQGY